jgi:hypothetical protein
LRRTTLPHCQPGVVQLQPFSDRLIVGEFVSCRFSVAGTILLERRKALRHRTFKGASIEFRGGSIDCTVRNLSEKGATLDVASPVGIPDRFHLHIKGDPARKCHLIWRKELRIGIEFDESSDLKS